MEENAKNESLEGLHRAVGQAISSWAAVEQQLYQIFGIATSLVVAQPGGGWSADLTTPNAILDAIDGFRPKLLMIQGALESSLRHVGAGADELRVEGSELLASANSLHRNRNKLAHWTACRLIKSKSEKSRFVLAPPPFSSREHQGVTETDIDAWSENFQEANQRLSNFVFRLASHRGLQRKHLDRALAQVLVCLPGDATLMEHVKAQLADYL